jgi:hypothetical protein
LHCLTRAHSSSVRKLWLVCQSRCQDCHRLEASEELPTFLLLTHSFEPAMHLRNQRQSRTTPTPSLRQLQLRWVRPYPPPPLEMTGVGMTRRRWMAALMTNVMTVVRC